MIRICPSIASADPLELRAEIDRLGQQYDSLHIDLEDGSYIPNITFGMKTVGRILGYADRECDVHITAANPEQYVEPLAQLGAKAICFHVELCRHPLVLLNHIRSFGMQAGIALSFQTQPEQYQMFQDALDYILLMTAEPDGRGEKFYPPVLKKIRRTRELFPSRVRIWVDGGIDGSNLPEVLQNGADTIVMGRGVWGQKNAPEAIENYRHMGCGTAAGLPH